MIAVFGVPKIGLRALPRWRAGHADGDMATSRFGRRGRTGAAVPTVTSSPRRHKSLRGPRSGMIFFRRGINPKTVRITTTSPRQHVRLPALQGGPHNHQIGALAVALKHAQTPEFMLSSKSRRTPRRAAKLSWPRATASSRHDTTWCSGICPLGLTGSKMEYLCDLLHHFEQERRSATPARCPWAASVGARVTSRGPSRRFRRRRRLFGQGGRPVLGGASQPR